MRLFERSVSPSRSCSWGIRMRFELLHRCALTLGFAAVGFLFLHPPGVHAQGGEPQYFAIRGAEVVTVSVPPNEGTTIAVSRGIIPAVAREAAVPPEASVIDGQGLTDSSGPMDDYGDVGLPTPHASA